MNDLTKINSIIELVDLLYEQGIPRHSLSINICKEHQKGILEMFGLAHTTTEHITEIYNMQVHTTNRGCILC